MSRTLGIVHYSANVPLTCCALNMSPRKFSGLNRRRKLVKEERERGIHPPPNSKKMFGEASEEGRRRRRREIILYRQYLLPCSEKQTGVFLRDFFELGLYFFANKRGKKRVCVPSLLEPRRGTRHTGLTTFTLNLFATMYKS